MKTFTTILPSELLRQLGDKAKELGIPRHKLIESAIRPYLEELEKAEYVKSYRRAATDKDMLAVADEGLSDYLNQVSS